MVDGNIIKQKKDYIELQITQVKSYDTTLIHNDVVCPHYLFPYAQKSDTPLHKQ